MKSYTCESTTVHQLAEKIAFLAPAYIDRPVVDLTGLEDAFDFTLSWTPKRAFGGAPARNAEANPPQQVPSASDPTGEITMFEAVEQQLGLKLNSQNYPVPVIVVERVNRVMKAN